MQLDRNALERLLALNDRQLMAIINKLVKESGIDAGELNIDTRDISKLRNALSSATDEDIKNIADTFNNRKRT